MVWGLSWCVGLGLVLILGFVWSLVLGAGFFDVLIQWSSFVSEVLFLVLLLLLCWRLALLCASLLLVCWVQHSFWLFSGVVLIFELC